MNDAPAPRDAPPPSGIRPNPDYVPAYIEQPAAWQYDVDQANGLSRATYPGEVVIAGATLVTSVSPAFTGTPTAPTPPPADSSNTLATTAFVQTAVAPALNDVGRNLIHNPAWTVWQRGTGAFAPAGAAYTADRWIFYLQTDTGNLSQYALTDAQRAQIGDEAAVLSPVINVAGNAAAGAFTVVFQKIEGVRRLAGKTVTASFWAWCGSGSLKIGVSLDQMFGTGGSPSTAVQNNGTSFTLSTTATRFSTTITLASASGKTLGTNGDDFSQLNLWFSSGSTNAARTGNVGVQSGAFGIWGVQLEIGSTVTPLAKRDPADDLALCQRFYQTGAVWASGYNTAGNAIGYAGSLPVRPRAAPTYALSGITPSNCSGVAIQPWIDQGAYQILANVSATGSANFYASFTASADL